jgi:hypothetical protein
MSFKSVIVQDMLYLMNNSGVSDLAMGMWLCIPCIPTEDISGQFDAILVFNQRRCVRSPVFHESLVVVSTRRQVGLAGSEEGLAVLRSPYLKRYRFVRVPGKLFEGLVELSVQIFLSDVKFVESLREAEQCSLARVVILYNKSAVSHKSTSWSERTHHFDPVEIAESRRSDEWKVLNITYTPHELLCILGGASRSIERACSRKKIVRDIVDEVVGDRLWDELAGSDSPHKLGSDKDGEIRANTARSKKPFDGGGVRAPVDLVDGGYSFRHDGTLVFKVMSQMAFESRV